MKIYKKPTFLILLSSSFVLLTSCGVNFSQTNHHSDSKIEKSKDLSKEEKFDKIEKQVNVVKNFSQKYSELEDVIKNFVTNELKSLKYETLKDKLNSTIDEIEYQKSINNSKLSDNFFENNFQKLSQLFNEIKKNYKNAPEIPANYSPNLEISNFKKEENNDVPVEARDYQNWETNLISNKNARSFMNLVGQNYVEPFQFQGYTEKHRQKVAEFTRKLIEKEGKKDEESKIRTIFNWIHQNVKYAYDLTKIPAINPADVIDFLYAVCGGYSNLYKAMLDSIGIKNSIVIGWSKYGAHQWNLVYDSKSKEYFHSDPTWGQFQRTDEEFAKDHKTFRILDTYYSKNGQKYEYNLGVSLFSSTNSEVKPIEQINNQFKVVGISQEVLKQTETLYVSKNVSQIEYKSGTFNVKNIVVDQENPYFASKDGLLYNKDFTKLILVPEKYERKSIFLPKTLKSIEDQKITLSAKNLEKIDVEPGNYWFRSFGGILYNNDLSKILFVPLNFQGKVVTSKNAKLDPHTFSFNQSLQEIEISEGVTEIPDFTFNNLSNLQIIHLPNSLEKISKEAFIGIDLKKIRIVYGGSNQNVIKTLKDLKIPVEIKG
ncbi:Uncharacterised protein [Mesomycoplasma dispar]|uniref:Transglutaminase-like domain-containing protein n=1 Tax=Mesomycoplasma dispar TaxID=86660 RepID=A0AAJ5NLR3_9BACT|nr:leucine-rich repeat protein [Mesomycoplasma dispar]AJR12364.1 cell surface protein [Mesomycoplasma dispar]VEU62234.1 Uncharacterised protein [Mesomycoplasma dispar]